MSEKTTGENRVIGTFQKSVNGSIQVSLVNWEGGEYVDVRQVIPSDKPGETWIYTKAGIRFNRDLVGELIPLLEEAKQA